MSSKKTEFYNGPWHAFYSPTQHKYSKEYKNISNKNRIIYTNFYRLKDSNETVEISSVYNIEKYPNPNDCPFYFNDKIYLGIVDKWISIGDCVYL